MDTRILRRIHRGKHRTSLGTIWDSGVWRVEGLGQLQPVLFSWRGGNVNLSIEHVANGRPCWMKYPLPRYKKEAKAVFAALEYAHKTGQRSAAAKAWAGR